MVAAGGWWWPQLAGCRPTLGSIPLSVSRLAVMSIMSTPSSLQSPGRHIPPSKVHFMEIRSNQDKERCKVSNVTNPNKILSSFVKPVFDFSQGSFYVVWYIKCGCWELKRADIYGPFENSFQNKKSYFRSKHRKKQTSKLRRRGDAARS